jgi:hypothetical protein
MRLRRPLVVYISIKKNLFLPFLLQKWHFPSSRDRCSGYVSFFCGFGSSDSYPDFMDPDPTHLLAIVNKSDYCNKNNFSKHHIKKFS